MKLLLHADIEKLGYFGDVVEVNEELLEQSTSNLHGVEAQFIAGMYKMEEELAVILDIDEILKNHERSIN